MKSCQHLAAKEVANHFRGRFRWEVYLVLCSDCGYRVALIEKMSEHPALVVRIPKSVRDSGRWVGELLYRLGHWGSRPTIHIDDSVGDFEFP